MTTEESGVSELRSIVTLVALSVAGVAYWNAMPFLVGGFVDDFGWSPELAGQISSLQLFATMGMLWVAAITVHRWNLRTTVLSAALVAVLSDFLAAWLESTTLMIVTRVVTGLAAGVILGAVYAAVSRVERPTRVYGIVMASMSGSGLVWFLGMPALLEYSGMTGPFLGIAAVSLVALVIALAWFPRYGRQEDVPSAQLGLLGMLTVPVLLLALGLFVQSTVAGAYWAYWERIGVDSGLGPWGIALVLSVGAVSGMLGGALAAWMDGKVGDATALIGGFSIMGLGYAVALFYTPAAYVAATVVSYVAGNVALTFFFGLFAKVDASGRLVNAANLLFYAGGAVGPAAASFMLVQGSYSPMIYGGSLALLASLFVIVPVLSRWAPGEPAVGLGDHA